MLQKSIALDLGADSFRFHVLDHAVILLRALWSDWAHMGMEGLVLQRAQSSAKREYLISDVLMMSFTITRKRSGLRTEPCGTPALTGHGEDSEFCSLTWI